MVQRRHTHRTPGGTSPSSEEQTSTSEDAFRGMSTLPGSWLVAVVVVRLASAVLNQTAFVPDEYWQSLEIAHRMVFGYPPH